MSMEKFEGDLGINIVSRNFDTGFIKLDENISVKQKSKNENGEDSKRKLFRKNHKDVTKFLKKNLEFYFEMKICLCLYERYFNLKIKIYER